MLSIAVVHDSTAHNILSMKSGQIESLLWYSLGTKHKQQKELVFSNCVIL